VSITTNPQTLFPGVTLGASLFQSQTGVNQVSSALAARVIGTGLNSQPAASTVTNELNTLINTLCTASPPTSPCASQPRVVAIATAACAAAFGSSDMLIN
jgi:hypothetical protein